MAYLPTLRLMKEKGFTYLRVGENPQLFRLTKKGFQIWTAEALQEKGFTAENAPYYAVLRFEQNTPIHYDQVIDLHKRKYTQVTHIEQLSNFIEIK